MPSVTISNGKNNLSQKLEQLIRARDMALEEAKKSPCVRRKYGAIFFQQDNYILAHNKRVSRCCNGTCIRDVMSITHGHNTDVGAEIHAEQALLIGSNYAAGYSMMIVGYGKTGKPLYGKDCWPCYSCARMIKEAGVARVWVPEEEDHFSAYVIEEVLEQYEMEILESFQ